MPGGCPAGTGPHPRTAAIEDVGAFLLGLIQSGHQELCGFDPGGQGGEEIASPVVVFLRGDHTVNLAKLTGLFAGARELRPMTAEELQNTFHSPAGYLGPIGLDAEPAASRQRLGRRQIIMDKALAGRRNLVAGANGEEYHLRNVTPGRDFMPTLTADVRNVKEGESCPQCPAPAKCAEGARPSK